MPMLNFALSEVRDLVEGFGEGLDPTDYDAVVLAYYDTKRPGSPRPTTRSAKSPAAGP